MKKCSSEMHQFELADPVVYVTQRRYVFKPITWYAKSRSPKSIPGLYISCAPDFIFFNEKKIGRIRMIFDIENWLWKSEFCDLQSQIHNRALICKRPFKVTKCLFPFNWSRVWFESCWKNLKWYLICTYQ